MSAREQPLETKLGALRDYNDRLDAMHKRLTILMWAGGLNLVLTVCLLWRLWAH